jgi:hypothetical protein
MFILSFFDYLKKHDFPLYYQIRISQIDFVQGCDKIFDLFYLRFFQLKLKLIYIFIHNISGNNRAFAKAGNALFFVKISLRISLKYL